MEKRSCPRMVLNQIVEFECVDTVLGPPAEIRATGIGRDISDAGVSLLTNCLLHRGEVLTVHVPVEAEATRSVLSEVKWIQPTRHGIRVGLKFIA
ncbi:PilZ domain-containing protein [Geothrix terrae]|uniref:PilZ domain-containing protein n=1 Tax=Geothrix terrae TaxID=2922720 RepID=UPI001FAC7C1B|nr:PilZ domain-containing protein [Geothrix terrae]